MVSPHFEGFIIYGGKMPWYLAPPVALFNVSSAMLQLTVAFLGGVFLFAMLIVMAVVSIPCTVFGEIKRVFLGF